MYVNGILTDYDEALGTATITAQINNSDAYLLKKQKIRRCEIRFDDGRSISAVQRKHIYAVLGDMADYTGYTGEQIKALMKYGFISETGTNYFSLHDCDMTTAREFLTYLIDRCVEWDIPTSKSLLEQCEDIGRYLYACVLARRCAICGRKADIHEYDPVGMGRDRRTIHHLGQRVIPLCRIHHTEAETIGRESFEEKHHVQWVRLDEYACKVLRWKP